MRPRIHTGSGVRSQVVDGEVVLLDLETEYYYGLDQVGSRVWQLLEHGATQVEIVTSLSREYDVSEAKLNRDIEQLIKELAGAGLVTIDTGEVED